MNKAYIGKRVGIAGLLIASIGVAFAQDDDSSRAMPGAGSGQAPRNVVPAGKPPAQDAYADKLKLGDYVELDDSIKNEMYGTVDFQNADLRDIIRAISKLTGKNFILDRKSEGQKITIISPQTVTKQEAYNAFLSALYMNDLTIVSMGKFLKIVNVKDAAQANIRVFVGDYAPPSEEIVTVIYPLKYLSAEDIQRFVVDLVPRNGRVGTYPNTNSLIMTDTGLNLRRVVAILKSIDVPGHEDLLETIPIRFASAKQVSALIDEILEAQTGQRRQAGPPGARQQQQKTRGGGTITKIVPDERTNSLIVLANGRGVQELKGLVDKLDTPNAAGGGNIHIYFCKNAVAEELATTVNALVSGQQANRNVNPGGQLLPPAPGMPYYNPGASRNSGGDGVKLEGNLKITSDKATNALVVIASGSDFAALKTILRKLDIPRRQVYVEATIMEVAAQNKADLGIGVNVAAQNVGQIGGFIPSVGGIDQKTLAGAIASPGAISGIVAGFKAGNSYSFGSGDNKIKVSSITGLIRAIVDSKLGQVLHQPQILTSDNLESKIEVKELIKVPGKSTSVSATNGGVSSLEKTFDTQNATVMLKIKPQIGEDSSLIKLQVEQTIDSFSPSALGEGQQDTTSRNANTTVVVRDGDTVVVGGLQKTTYDDARSKIPLLGDLPVLGWLFKGSTSEARRSNLILFLTPKIIREYSDLLNITGNKLDERIQIGKQFDDPKDRGRPQADKMLEKNKADKERNVSAGWGFKPLREASEEPVEPEATEEKTDESDIRKSSGDDTEELLPTEAAADPYKKEDSSAYMSGAEPPRAVRNSGTTTLDNMNNNPAYTTIPAPTSAPVSTNNTTGRSSTPPAGR